jgi:hypothetical protein
MRKASKKPQQSLKPILAEPLAKTLHLGCAGKYFPILVEIGVFQQNKPEVDGLKSRLSLMQKTDRPN